MDKLKLATRNVFVGSLLAPVFLLFFILWSQQAQADGELWKALILAVSSNLIVFVWLLILAVFWRTVRKCEKQNQKIQ